MPVLIQIALGGAIGAVLRHLCVAGTMRLAGGAFPWGTLAVNVLGSFAMGLVAALILGRGGESGLLRAAPFLMPGLLGGFTTFSAFSLELFQLVERGRLAAALAYAGGSVALGLAALLAGIWLGRSAGPA